MSGRVGTVTDRVRTVVCGAGDPRIRATWRFLLAWTLFPLVEFSLAVAMPVLGLSGMIPGGPIQGVIFVVMLLAWAWAIDRRPLSDYGVSASMSWLVDLLAGFTAALVVYGGLHALAVSLGWMHVETSMTAPQDSLLVGLGGTFVSLGINTWVQDTIFFTIVLTSASEGVRSRGVEPTRAVLGGWVVAVLFFTVIHGLPGPLDVLSHVVGGAVFGLLYVHTGELALTIGVHWGTSYGAGMVFASPAMAEQFPSVFRVTKSLPDSLDGALAIPLYVGIYLVLLGWVVVREGEVTIDTSLAQWPKRR